jgi:enoyl-CoA hydratase/carnithine racemase
MTEIPVTSETRGAVRVLRMNRPEKKNALTAAMYGALAAGISSAAADEACRAVLILGVPGAFCAGNDLSDFLAAAMGGRQTNEVFDFLMALATTPKPLVAGVDGTAVGVGVTMLFHCDQVVASDRSVFRTPFTDLGLVPEAGSSLIAPRYMGQQRAFALLAMGEAFDAEAARAAGFVGRIAKSDDLEATALAVANAIAAKPAGALAETRRLLRGEPADIVARIRLEGEIFRGRLKSDEARKAFEAFFARR